ncbi:MAG: hypothetical protein Q8S84_07290 [bacterium]|nr:hypothetical protein [bacterium]MDP3381256.1 hypothetical protein [bacterium]
MYSSTCFELVFITSSTIISNAQVSFFCLRLFSSTITSASHQLLNNSSITCFEFKVHNSSLFTNSITLANSFISNFNSSTLFITSDSLIIANNTVVK